MQGVNSKPCQTDFRTVIAVAAKNQRFDLDAYSKDNNATVDVETRWPEVSGIIYQAATRVVESLRRHEAALPGKW